MVQQKSVDQDVEEGHLVAVYYLEDAIDIHQLYYLQHVLKGKLKQDYLFLTTKVADIVIADPFAGFEEEYELLIVVEGHLGGLLDSCLVFGLLHWF